MEDGDNWVNDAVGQPRRAGHQGSAEAHAERAPGILEGSREELERRFRRNDDRRASPLPDDEGRQAAGAGDQRQRLGHQVEVRQPLRLPRIARRRHQARDRRDGRRQGRRRLRLRRRRQRLARIRCAASARASSSPRSIRSTRCRPRWKASKSPRSKTRSARADIYVTDDRQQGHHHARAHAADEGPGDRLQHRPLRQRDPGRSPEQREGRQARQRSSRRSTTTMFADGQAIYRARRRPPREPRLRAPAIRAS